MNVLLTTEWKRVLSASFYTNVCELTLWAKTLRCWTHCRNTYIATIANWKCDSYEIGLGRSQRVCLTVPQRRSAYANCCLFSWQNWNDEKNDTMSNWRAFNRFALPLLLFIEMNTQQIQWEQCFYAKCLPMSVLRESIAFLCKRTMPRWMLSFFEVIEIMANINRCLS